MKEKKTAKMKIILYAMLMGEKLTPHEANKIADTTDGTRYIRYIREVYPVKSERIEGKSYYKYWIDEDYIQRIKDKCRELKMSCDVVLSDCLTLK